MMMTESLLELREEHITISEEELSLSFRLDKLLATRYPPFSRTYFQYLIEEKCVLVNGSIIKKRYQPQLGDEIEICFLLTPELDVFPEEIPLEILFEDEHLLAVNKPPHMVVHPAPGATSATFANALLFHCKQLQKEEFASLRPGIVHRLDKDTSGVLIAAKTRTAHQLLVEQFAKRKIEKRYLAVCYGKPMEGHFAAPIKRDEKNRKQMAIDPLGKEAISVFKVLAEKEGLSLVEVELITGRTHQIRVHLKALKAPILGDEVYGISSLNRKFSLSRQLLHAFSLAFHHPITGQRLELKAPLAPDMKNFIDRIHFPSVQ